MQAHDSLVQVRQRKDETRELFLRKRVEQVRLVFGEVERLAQLVGQQLKAVHVLGDTGIMTGSDLGSQPKACACSKSVAILRSRVQTVQGLGKRPSSNSRVV